jgi:5-hydroxyisourate hydrolase
MISTHVLDTALGVPGAGIDVALETKVGAAWAPIGRGTTDTSGRIASFSNAVLQAGTYRLTFATAAYHRRSGVTPFFPEVVVTFEAQQGAHYHVPLLLSPYGFSTYRGT